MSEISESKKSYYWRHRSEVLAKAKSYYLFHRSEISEKVKVRRKANLEVYRKRGREAERDWRKRNLELNRKRHCKYFKRWRNSHRKAHKAIHTAQYNIPLGSCCEFCGSGVGLMRVHIDYEYPLAVVIACRECRSWMKYKRDRGLV